MPAYWRHGKEFLKSNHVSRAGVTAWTRKKAVEESEQARQRPAIQIQPVARELEGKEGKIWTVRTPVPEQGTPAVTEELHGASHTIKLRYFLESEGRLGLDVMVILKER